MVGARGAAHAAACHERRRSQTGRRPVRWRAAPPEGFAQLKSVFLLDRETCYASLVQYLSAKIGIASERNLPELCRDTMPRPVSFGLWVQAEAIAV
ncbi:MAG: divalent metal cation transporter, partial [Thermoleophilaceae bacterium]|nr:divalent metal cation transporter [Thermoleophilaceae bacterium]